MKCANWEILLRSSGCSGAYHVIVGWRGAGHVYTTGSTELMKWTNPAHRLWYYWLFAGKQDK